MIFSQVTLQVETTVKKKNGAEANVIKPIVLPAVKQRISQTRLDEFSMIGLGKNVRYELNGIGETEDLLFLGSLSHVVRLKVTPFSSKK